MSKPKEGREVLSTPNPDSPRTTEKKRLALDHTPLLLTEDLVRLIPDEKPLALFDLDGTLTVPDRAILMEKFLRTVKIGSQTTRQGILRIFDDWRERKIEYGDCLKKTGEGWALLLSQTRPRISQSGLINLSEEWYEDHGQEIVMRYAAPMMMDVRRYGLESAMITGSPYEMAAPFARRLGIKHLFAMGAELDSRGRYTGVMKTDRNTGITRNKTRISQKIRRTHRTGIAAGDNLPDRVLMDTAINRYHPSDLEGRGLLMNAEPNVMNAFREGANEQILDGKIIVMERGLSNRRVMEVFRDTLGHIFRDNGMKHRLREIEYPNGVEA